MRLVQACGGVAAAGRVLVLTAPGAAPALAGWALFGLGLAAVAPTLLGAAARTGEAPAPIAVAAVSTVGYLGSFTAAPAIGTLAGASSLSTALAALVVVSTLLGLFANPALGDAT